MSALGSRLSFGLVSIRNPLIFARAHAISSWDFSSNNAKATHHTIDAKETRNSQEVAGYIRDKIKLSPYSLFFFKRAAHFERVGEMVKAAEVYKQIIDMIPKSKKAYQKLWDLWLATNSLKVPKNEFDDFKYKYERYILKKNISTSSEVKIAAKPSRIDY